MTPEQIAQKSRALSRLLRHDAGEVGLTMDAAGFVPVREIVDRLRISMAALDEIVRLNNKRRLEWSGDRIRCCQGHSRDGMPVTLDALEASWVPWAGGMVWHGTRMDAVAPIAREGIVAGRRTHVHLASATDSEVGKRASVDVVLAVDPGRMAAAGLGLWVAPNGVVLARAVPPGCIVGLQAMTRRARGQEAALRALLAGA